MQFSTARSVQLSVAGNSRSQGDLPTGHRADEPDRAPVVDTKHRRPVAVVSPVQADAGPCPRRGRRSLGVGSGASRLVARQLLPRRVLEGTAKSSLSACASYFLNVVFADLC